MELTATKPTTIEQIFNTVQSNFPQYKVQLKKNPVMKFQYVQVRKSAYVGNWIRFNEKTNKVQFINAIPSTLARAFFGGLIAILIALPAQRKLGKEISAKLEPSLN